MNPWQALYILCTNPSACTRGPCLSPPSTLKPAVFNPRDSLHYFSNLLNSSLGTQLSIYNVTFFENLPLFTFVLTKLWGYILLRSPQLVK